MYAVFLATNPLYLFNYDSALSNYC